MAAAASQMRISSAGTSTRSTRGTARGRWARWGGDMGSSCRRRSGPTPVWYMSLAEEDNSSAGYVVSTIWSMVTPERGPPAAARTERPPGAGWVYSLVANDPHGELVDRSGVGPGELAQIDELMGALARSEEHTSELQSRGQ